MRVFVAGPTGARGHRHHEAQMTSWRGSSNQKARKQLGWEPRYASWREGFRAWVGG
ncbi:MAG TPA: hypothetical protein VGJ53_00645 [Micromonosporaceae bacterium]|jgi:hypothetical protein